VEIRMQRHHHAPSEDYITVVHHPTKNPLTPLVRDVG